jgi:phosphatidylserine/phosphatidylglycerophosphate/cardiolipin synthase-like enzyme
MEPLTIVGAFAAGLSVIGYVLFKGRKNGDSYEEIKRDNYEVPFKGNENEKISYAFTKTSQVPQEKINEIIDRAKSKLDVAIYTFTDSGILSHILQATNRGVKVRLVTDSRQTVNAKGQNKVLQQLSRAGVPIKVNSHSGYMHLKVLIADETKVITGSYNYTNAAKTKHDEVVIVIENGKMAKEWTEQFNRIWNDENNFKDLNQELPFINAS